MEQKTIFHYDWADRFFLVVDDQEVNRFYFEKALKCTSASLYFAGNGLEAVRMVTARPEIDLVLMDLRLPVLGGFEATRRIKELRSELPVIAQTAFAQPEIMQEVMAAGFNDVIVKPIRLEHLYEMIEKQLMTS